MSARMRRFPFGPRRAGITGVLVALLATAGPVLAATPAPAGSRPAVRALELDDLGLSSPHAIARDMGRALLHVLEPGAGPERTRITTLTALDDPLGSVDVALALDRCAGVALDASAGRLLVVDEEGGLGSFGLRADGAVDGAAPPRAHALPRVGPLRIAGMTIDPATGRLYLLDRLSRRVLSFTLDPDGAAAGALWIPLGALATLDLQALAWHPVDSDLRLFARDGSTVHALAPDGTVRGALALGATALAEPRAAAFMPTRDRTDDPAAWSLLVAGRGPAGHAGLFEIRPERAASLGSSVIHATPTLVRIIDTSAWAIPSPDCSGLAYHPPSGRLMLVDGEVEEVRIWRNVNFFELTLDGSYVRGVDLTPFSDEPVGVAYNPLNRHVWITDDDSDEITEIDPGGDGLVGTADDVRTFFDARTIGSGDPEGATYDPVGNKLYITDSESSEIYELSPGPNGRFDGVDDDVRSFDTGSFASDPECVEFHPTRRTLFLIGTGSSDLVETTTSGSVVATYDLSMVPEDHPSGMTFAPGSTNPHATHVYIAYRNVDNDSNSSENDGAIAEIALEGTAPPPTGSGTTAPTVTIRIAAGSDDAEESATGSVSVTGGDLELVLDSNLQTVGLRFPNVAVANNAVIDSAFLQFKADESHSGATSLVIQGQAADNAATFRSTSRDVSSRPRTTASTSWTPPAWTAGQAGRAQRSPNLAPVIQQIVSRAGWASGNALALIVTGSGRRIAETCEGDRAGAPELVIHVGTGASTGPTNAAPLVDAGTNASVTMPDAATLDGTVTDDGLPGPPNVTTLWTGAGPGPVAFVNDRAVDTQASFTVAGAYVLRLTANDGQLATTDSVLIDVRAPVPPGGAVTIIERRIAAGSDDAEEKLTGSVSLTSSDLELTTDGSTVQRIGMRFTGLGLPPGAVVTNAWIQFKVETVTSDVTVLAIRAQKATNAATFTTATGNVGTRPPTTATVAWTPAPWTVSKAVGAEQRTPDLSPLLNELTAMPGWSATSPVVIVVTGTGKRIAESYEGDRLGAPLLHVEYRN